MFEFHISRASRERYGVDGVLFSYDGNAVFADPAASRALAHRMNEARGAEADPGLRVQPAALFAMGLIDEAAHALFDYYRLTVAPHVMREAIGHFGQQIGEDVVESLLLRFVTEFPGADIYAGEVTPEEWLNGQTEGLTHREAAFEELLLLWFENRNPAFAPFRELFDDAQLRETTAYAEITAGLPEFFAAQPELGGDRGGMFELLLGVLGSGSTLNDQLALLRGKWGFAVETLLRKLLLAHDVLKEEEISVWLQFNPPDTETLARRNRFDGWANAPAQVPEYATAPAEYEHFSPDQEWMPRTVMIAKSTYVWLNQLSRFYGREILRLDQIPDEELQTLASRGMNALWLIGVWERSRASQTIKRLCGNGDAVASAYSLYDYRIADNLGGDWAYQNLRDRCSRYGIRLASDMVPNHMGIDSPWVIEHPEWFLSRSDSPYPAYTFNGPDLSGNDRVEIKIEDHYYNQSDASVVFMRRDKWTGDTQFVYHGNDGTSFPWNDTAQLNYMSAAVREQVMQTILHVARLFPIIRFDAAMTLAKRHIQRLWFPAPGSGGAIPSRAESAITTDEFDRLIPLEFWREVVDHVAREVPGTLLLAEAFWMMEGYFVRTLGMHRVYNSAFMVMLRDEDNANYRTLLKKTLEFDPGILNRYVNFMSNPDERTAIDQFGDGDKYFGVATLMSTLPGLPMFGHGQIEGFTEKYGMEYYRPRHEEWPQQWMVDRHNREIAPLLYQRALFAESDNFLLYVFAYSNYHDGQRALIAYNNSYSSAHGTLHGSVAYMDKGAGELRQRSIADGLKLPHDDSVIIAWRNNRSGQFHLRRSHEFHEHGLRVDLNGYGYLVMLDWRELRADATHAWDRLCEVLGGRGVDDLDNALLALELEHVHHALREALVPKLVREFATLSHRTAETVREDPTMVPHSETLEHWIEAGGKFIELTRAEYFKRVQPSALPENEPKLKQEQAPGFEKAEWLNETSLTKTRLRERIAAMLRLPLVEAHFAEVWPVEARKVLPSASPQRNAGSVWAPVLAYSLLATLGESLDFADPARPALSIYDAFGLRGILALAFSGVEFSGEDTWRAAARVRIALVSGVYASDLEPQSLHTEPPQERGLPRSVWEDGDVRWLVGVNEHQGVQYCNSESLEQMIWWRALPRLLAAALESPVDATAVKAIAAAVHTAKADAKATGFTLPEEKRADVAVDTHLVDAHVLEQAGIPAEETAPVADDQEPSVESEDNEPETVASTATGAPGKRSDGKKDGGKKSKKR
jgi:glycosidase